MHCDVISMIFSYYSKPNFSGKNQNEDIRRSYQPILHQLYTEAIKRRGGISLHKHFNVLQLRTSLGRLVEKLVTSLTGNIRLVKRLS